MGKRFTDTEIFRDPWYRKLPIEMKVAWDYLYHSCDNAGVIDLDRELAEFQIGAEVDWDDFLRRCKGRIEILSSGKLWLTRFIEFQYGKLSESCKPHIPVFHLLRKHGIDLSEVRQNDTFKYGSVTAQRRQKLFERDDFTCCYCGEVFDDKDLVPDHVTPASKGGNDSLDNLVAACKGCNASKSDRDVEVFVSLRPDPESILKRLSLRLPNRLSDSLKEKDKDKDKEQDKEKEGKGGAGGKPKFTPPTLDEVRAYCQERGNSLDAEHFWNHYQANGWVQGNAGKPIKNWKACVVTWEKNNTTPRGSPRNNTDPRGNLALRDKLLAEMESQ